MLEQNDEISASVADVNLISLYMRFHIILIFFLFRCASLYPSFQVVNAVLSLVLIQALKKEEDEARNYRQ